MNPSLRVWCRSISTLTGGSAPPDRVTSKTRCVHKRCINGPLSIDRHGVVAVSRAPNLDALMRRLIVVLCLLAAPFLMCAPAFAHAHHDQTAATHKSMAAADKATPTHGQRPLTNCRIARATAAPSEIVDEHHGHSHHHHGKTHDPADHSHAPGEDSFHQLMTHLNLDFAAQADPAIDRIGAIIVFNSPPLNMSLSGIAHIPPVPPPLV